MSAGNIAYLALVGAGFAIFMTVLAYGYIRSNWPERGRPAAKAAPSRAGLDRAA
jgi:hypothetical protein